MSIMSQSLSLSKRDPDPGLDSRRGVVVLLTKRKHLRLKNTKTFLL